MTTWRICSSRCTDTRTTGSSRGCGSTAEPLLRSRGVLNTDRVVRQLLKAGVADQPRIALHAALVARAAHQPEIALALDAQVERLREGLQGIFVDLIAKTGRTMTVAPRSSPGR